MAATRKSWKQTPFIDGRPIPFKASFTREEFAKLREGLIPEEMEDKWFIFYEEPHLFLHRSWTGQPVFRVTLAPGNEGATATEAQSVPDPGTKTSPEYEADLLDFLISNLLLGQSKPYPFPPGGRQARPGLLQQHAVAGTGFPQTGVPRRRRWWWPWR